MQAGELKHRMQLERPAETEIGGGELSAAYVPAFPADCALIPISAAEQMRKGQISHDVSHLIKMRYSPAVRASWRFRYGDRLFHIKSLINVGETNTELNLLVTEEANG